MEVDLVITSKSHPTELEITSNTRNIFNIADLFNATRESRNVKDHVPKAINMPHNDSTSPMICNATIQEDNKVPIVGTNMDIRDSISI
jgi:hypothetical protein